MPLGDVTALLGRGTLAATPIEPPIHLTAHVVHDGDDAPARAAAAVRALLASVIAQRLRDKALVGMEPVQA